MRSGEPAPVPWFFRTRRALLASIAVVLLVPLAVFALALRTTNERRMRAVVTQANETAAELGAESIRAHFGGLAAYAESYARRSSLVAAVRGLETVAVRAVLRELVEGNPWVDRAFVASEIGVELVDWPEDPGVIGQDFSHRDWFLGVTASGATYVSEVYERAARPKGLRVAFATPIGTGTSPSPGVLVVQVRIPEVAHPLTRVAPAPGGTLRLLDRKGRWVRERERAQDIVPFAGTVLLSTVSDPGESAPTVGDPVTEERSFIARRPVAPYGWTVVALVPERAVTGPLRAQDVATLALTVVLFVALTALGFFGSSVVRKAHLSALRLQETKDDLVGMIVHDMRNPLTALQGNLDLAEMRTPSGDEKLDGHVRASALSCGDLRNMCQMLVDVTRLEEGHFPLAKVTTDLVEIARRKVDEYAGAAEARSVTLCLASHQPTPVYADVSVIERMVGNLVTNALKHTPAGGFVGVEIGEDAERRESVLRVRDTGEAVPPEAIPQLFQKYGRVHERNRVTRSDTGLGLVFCRLAAESHGGTIAAESRVGEGTTFVVRLPWKRT